MSTTSLPTYAALHPIPLVARLLATVYGCTTLQGLGQVAANFNSAGSVFQTLLAIDQTTVRHAWRAQRCAIVWSLIWGSLSQITPREAIRESAPVADLDVAALASETADTSTLGSQADGSRRGVGFSTVEGYRQALLRGGLQPHTRAEYLGRVGGQDVYPPANQVTQGPAVPVNAAHASGNMAAAAMISRRARRVAARQDPNSPESRAAAIAAARAAGAKLAGYDGQVIDPGTGDIGTIIAFGRHARGKLDLVSGRYRQALIPWGEIESIRESLNLPKGTFGRSPGSVGLLGDATQILNNGGYVARRIKAAAIPSFEDASIMIPVRSAWKIGFFDNRADSDSMGKREATIALVKDGADLKVICDNSEHAGARAVIEDYQRRVAGTMIPSDDLLTRVEAAFRRECGARSTDLGLYVSPAMADRAVSLANALRPVIGRNVYCYAHTHAESIGAALTESVTESVDKLEGEIAKPDYKATPATIKRIEQLRTEIRGLAGLLGEGAVTQYRVRLDALDLKVTEGMSATTQRAMNIELD